jgi:uncharacterized protein (TIGR00266 family)
MNTQRRAHEIDYKIIGNDIQIVEIELDPQETVIAEAGAMMFMEQNIQFETKMGDGSNPNSSFFDKLKQVGSRILTGESLFMTHFTNKGYGKAKVSFAAPYPGTILPIDLSQIHGNELIVQKDAFLCAALGTKVTMHLNKKLGAGIFGGEGFILQKLTGDGLAFIHAGGTLIERTLNNETLRVDTGCVVGFEHTIDFDITRSGNLKSMIFGGEGLFLTTLRGSGRVWLQSMPISKLVRALSPFGRNTGKESGGILGNIGGLGGILED